MLSIYLFRSHLLEYGGTVADQNTYDDTTTIDRINRSAAFVPTIEYGQTERSRQALVLSLHCSLSIYFAPTCLSMGELSRNDTMMIRSGSSDAFVPCSTGLFVRRVCSDVSLTLCLLLLLLISAIQLHQAASKTKKGATATTKDYR